MSSEINLQLIKSIHQRDVELWHEQSPQVIETGMYEFVQKNHMHNFLLWHEEDKARRDDMGFEYVYHAKRSIDSENQMRNNAMESMDRVIYESLGGDSMGDEVECNSESPGFMIDRLSILALKKYHMAEQVERVDATDAHRQQCQLKFEVIMKQQENLSKCLNDFLAAMQGGQRSFRVYYQFKMYNDASLNPQLYQKNNSTEKG